MGEMMKEVLKILKYSVIFAIILSFLQNNGNVITCQPDGKQQYG